MLQLIKGPLILSAVVIVLRIIFELADMASGLQFVLGVTWLHLLVPIYLALKIVGADGASPFKALFAAVSGYSIGARLMVFVTYVIAYPLNWTATRFTIGGGGGVGADSALQGMLLIPLQNLALTIIGTIIIGMLLGSATIFIRRLIK